MANNSQSLWAPWRMDYLTQLSDDPDQPASMGQTCFLCQAGESDVQTKVKDQRLILHQTDDAVLLMNRYPYANGHLLVAPTAHVPDLIGMSEAQRSAVMSLAELGTRLLKDTMHPNGFNVGMNLGIAGGAAVPGHAHMHVVPRWNGDTNFMRVVGNTRVIPQALDAAFAMLKDALPRHL